MTAKALKTKTNTLVNTPAPRKRQYVEEVSQSRICILPPVDPQWENDEPTHPHLHESLEEAIALAVEQSPTSRPTAIDTWAAESSAEAKRKRTISIDMEVLADLLAAVEAVAREMQGKL